MLCEAPVRPSGHSTAIRTGDEPATPKSAFATNRPGWPCELSGQGGQVDHRISTIAVEIPSRTSPTRSRTAVSEVDTPNPFDSDAEDTSTTTPEPSGLTRVLTDSPSTTRPSSWSCSQISCTKTAISVRSSTTTTLMGLQRLVLLGRLLSEPPVGQVVVRRSGPITAQGYPGMRPSGGTGGRGSSRSSPNRPGRTSTRTGR